MTEWTLVAGYFLLTLFVSGLVLLWIIPEAAQLGKDHHRVQTHAPRHKPRRAALART